MFNINNLTIEEKIGQMLMIGMDTSDIIDKIDDLIIKYKIGGIILYKKNYKNYSELIEVINYIKKLNTANKIPLFIAIDQEGGRVNRMPPDFNNLPSANKLAKYTKEDLVEQAGEITGEMLSKLGINFDLAPVLDIKRFEDRQAIGDRAFSDNVEEVSKCGITYMKQLQNKNVISTIKHFPGHGATDSDTHFIIPKIKKDISDIEKEDMIPFEKAIENDADVILIGHLRIGQATQNKPATMSRRFITKYLRKKYRYNGVIITDDMRMKGIELFYGKNKPIKRAFYSGNDIVMFKYDNNEKVIEDIISKVKEDNIKQARVNRSVNRILKLKEKYNINDNEVEFNEKFVTETNDKIQELKNKMEGEG